MMNKEILHHTNFDIERIKNVKKKRIVRNALSSMQLTLTPLLYINYLRAISRTHYKVSMEILRVIDSYDFDHAYDESELPPVGTESGQALLTAILYDMKRCQKTYRGGFIYGIVNEMKLADNSAAHEILEKFIVNYFNRMNYYVCNHC